MNICLIGPGEQPNKFGQTFLRKAQALGHHVKTMSHRDHSPIGPDHQIADYQNPEHCRARFQQLVQDWSKIDILVFNASTPGYPNAEEMFTSSAKVDHGEYIHHLTAGLVIPHVISVSALKHMDQSSKIVFLATGLATSFDRTGWTNLAGYAGIKAYLNHLMLALSHHNDRAASVCCVSPHFPYDDPANCEQVMDKVTQFVLSHDHTASGKIHTFHVS